MKFKLLLASLLSLLPLAAQEASGIKANIDFVSWGEDLAGVTVGDANKSAPVSVQAFRYSDSMKYSGPQTISVYWTGGKASDHVEVPKDSPVGPPPPAPAETPSADDPAPPKIPDEILKRRAKEPTLAAIIPLISGASQITVLLAPGPENTLRFYVIDDDPARFPFGKIKVHNYSVAPVGVAFNKGKMAELKFQDTLTAPTDAEGSVTYQISYKKDTKWKVQENNMLHVDPTEQIHFIILQSDASFFRSSDGSRGGKLQTVTLRRQKPQQ